MERKKVAVINCAYREYSTGTIIESIIKNLSGNYEFYFFAEMGERRNFDQVHDFLITPHWSLWIHNKIAKVSGLYFWFGIFPTWRMVQRLKRIKPAILHLHCPNMGTVQLPMLLRYAAKNHLPVMMTNHCEVFYTSGCWHANECLEFVSGCKYCIQRREQRKPDLVKAESKILGNRYKNLIRYTMVAVSPWQRERMDRAGLARGARRITILNGVDTDVFKERKGVEQQLFCRKVLKGAKQEYTHIILHVTALFSIDKYDLKGGRYLVSLAQKMPTVLFLIVGNSEIRDVSVLPENIRIEGYTDSPQILSNYYSMADITILTSMKETFGMVCAESLCCGTPVVGFRNGGSDSIADVRYSSFVLYGDVDELKAEAESWLDFKKTHSPFGDMVKEVYSLDTMVKKYKEEYDLLTNEHDI